MSRIKTSINLNVSRQIASSSRREILTNNPAVFAQLVRHRHIPKGTSRPGHVEAVLDWSTERGGKPTRAIGQRDPCSRRILTLWGWISLPWKISAIFRTPGKRAERKLDETYADSLAAATDFFSQLAIFFLPPLFFPSYRWSSSNLKLFTLKIYLKWILFKGRWRIFNYFLNWK